MENKFIIKLWYSNCLSVGMLADFKGKKFSPEPGFEPRFLALCAGALPTELPTRTALVSSVVEDEYLVG